MAETLNGDAVVHIRFEGRSQDIRLGDLDLGPRSSDSAVKQALARYLQVPEGRLRDYVIDRHETGNLTVRPALLPPVVTAKFRIIRQPPYQEVAGFLTRIISCTKLNKVYIRDRPHK